MTFNQALVLAFGAAAISTDASAQRLLIPESSNDMIMEFDPMTGALIDAAAIDLSALSGGMAATPIKAVDGPNGEIWVSDQLADTVFRISSDGTTFLGATPALLDNARGLTSTPNGVLVTNSGTFGGAPGDALVELDSAGASVGSTAIGDPFDVTPYTFNGVAGYLVSDIAGEDLVFVDGSNHANQTLFHDSDGITGIDFPEQVHVTSTGRVFAGGFTAPSGIYEYDSTGAQINFIDTVALGGLGGIRGVFLLGNGNLLFTNGAGVHVYDTTTSAITTEISGVSARFASIIDGTSGGGIGAPYCMANANSTGVAGIISATGSRAVVDNDVTIGASQLPTNSFGFFITSQTQGFVANPGGSAGNLCLGGSIGRYVGPGQIQNSGAGGSFSLDVDLTQMPQPNGSVAVLPGDDWNFQVWYRDAVSGVPTSNFTGGIAVNFL